MKKLTSLLLTVALAFALTACDGAASSAAQTPQPTDAADQTPEPTATAAPATAEANTPEAPQQGGTLVAYFSCTGNTQAVADCIAAQTGADLYVITPAEPYTADDLNYNDDNCRANQEMNDPAARPVLGGEPLDLTGYDTVYLGYPIWWGTAPRIIESFLDSYDLSGCTVYLFCTSGSSGIDQSLNDLQAAYPAVSFAAAHRFAGADETAVQDWLDTLH